MMNSPHKVVSTVTVGVFVCVLSIVLGACHVSPSWAKNVPEPIQLEKLIDNPSVVTLTLADAVLQALEHNLDITISRQARDVRVTDILFEQAKFDPTVELTGRYDRSIAPLNRPIFGFGGVTQGNDPDNFAQTDAQVSLGFAQKLPTGANYDLTMDTTRNAVAGETSFLFNPSYTSNLLLNLTQPLLRDFGTDVNL
ncbi:MAG: TolC family protein, partial [Nitrospirota bacterium]|nr:TolC family protein [Nitrospirota bacterium]